MRLRSVPNPMIEIEGVFETCPGTNPGAKNMKPGVYPLSLDGQTFDVLTTLISSDTGRPALRMKLCPRARPVLFRADKEAKARYVVFHVFDFPDLFKTDRGTITLENGMWIVRLHQRADHRSIWETSRADGIGRRTHLGELRRRNGDAFTFDDAEEQLALLDRFLAFVRGTWCDPVLSVGFDDEGARLWEVYHEPPARRLPAASWRDRYYSIQIVDLYPLFSRRWNQSSEWRNTLLEVIYWYVSANSSDGRPGIDASIIMIQAALERLAYQHVVIEKRLMSKGGFSRKQLWATDKLRLLLSSNNIPIDVPSSCRSLMANTKWLDGPHAFVEVRNVLVHPDPDLRSHESGCVPEAWRLGLWYFELAVLAICGYEGSYANRLTQERVGQVEMVPWGKNVFRSNELPVSHA